MVTPGVIPHGRPTVHEGTVPGSRVGARVVVVAAIVVLVVPGVVLSARVTVVVTVLGVTS